MSSVFEQAARFTEIWTDFATKMATSGMTVDPGSTPPEAAQQVRGAMLSAMSHYADDFMRSPQFLEMMRQSFDAAISFRQQLNQFLTSAHHNMQGIARQDIDSLLLSVRHMETRVLDRMEELSSRLDEIGKRLETLEGGGRAKPRAKARPAPRPAAAPVTETTSPQEQE